MAQDLPAPTPASTYTFQNDGLRWGDVTMLAPPAEQDHPDLSAEHPVYRAVSVLVRPGVPDPAPGAFCSRR